MEINSYPKSLSGGAAAPRLESWLLPLSAVWPSAVTSILSTLHGLIEKDETRGSKKGSPARIEEN